MSSKTITHISWHPERTEPTNEPAAMHVDYSDGTQEKIVAETDVSSKIQLVQDAHSALF